MLFNTLKNFVRSVKILYFASRFYCTINDNFYRLQLEISFKPIVKCLFRLISFKMNITRENVDALNAVVKVDIAKEDYSDKVEKILTDYRKTANIPGFRKGHVPMGMVKKQYGKAVLVDEVNKLITRSFK